ncbi:hypothetical protein ACTXQV_79250, partial [Klebsiella pneumoniae]
RAYCLKTQPATGETYPKSDLFNKASISLKHINEDASVAEKAVKELSSITNLIIEDGFNEYRFVHKSTQEFF